MVRRESGEGIEHDTEVPAEQFFVMRRNPDRYTEW
jgi:hypothetical protein